MKKFLYMEDSELSDIFCQFPQTFDKGSPKELLQYALGGLLYVPASNEAIAEIVLKGKIKEATAIAVCLEDAIGDNMRRQCMKNVKRNAALIKGCMKKESGVARSLPLLFVRIKNTDMLREWKEFFIEYASVFTGVILPKVDKEMLMDCLSVIHEINQASCETIYAMPILESEELVLIENRITLLKQYQSVMEPFREYILNVRVGATDLSGLYGIRRRRHTPIHSISVVDCCLSDIIRVFAFRNRYIVSGPVWEYYSDGRALAEGRDAELKGLLRETGLNIENGFIGKTAVHPSQLCAIDAMHSVSLEEYQDAAAILKADENVKGVLSSSQKNKMNELKPHHIWAEKIQSRGALYGVYREGKCAEDLLRIYWKKELAL